MENKENAIRPSEVSSQHTRRVLREINTCQMLADVPKTEVETPRFASGDAEPEAGPSHSASADAEPEELSSDTIFPDIRPEAFSQGRRTLRNLAGRIYLIYCHLCCLDKKFRLTESDDSYDSDNEIEEIVVRGEDDFYFGKTPEIELEKLVLNTARYSFGGSSKTGSEPSTSSNL